MNRRHLLVLAVVSCGPAPAATSTPSSTHASAAITPSATPVCLAARALRAKATELDGGGHEMLALAKLDEANTACPGERPLSAPLEMKTLASLGRCADARALAPLPVVDAATCAEREAPSKGTEATMRAKMREAYRAELAKDFARAKTLYLEAWAENHPNARALEDAARMAALAGDAPEARRTRDRALAEAEASEHTAPQLTGRVRASRGSPLLSGSTLLLGLEGKVIARDLTTGELRVMVDAQGSGTRLSPMGTLAISSPTINVKNPLAVYDVLTGALLFRIPNAGQFAIAPDDSLIAVSDDDPTGTAVDSHVRVYDVATGQVKTKVTGKWHSGTEMLGFPDASHLIFFGNSDDPTFKPYDLDKSAYTNVRMPSAFGVGAISRDGHIVSYLENLLDGAPIHVRDMVENKDLAQWTGRFHSVEALAVSNDGKAIATGSISSLRLWDAAQKKQIAVHATNFGSIASQSDVDPRYPWEYTFSDDSKTLVLAGTSVATAWDVATGKEKPLVVDAPQLNVLRVVRAPDGIAIITEEEVHVIPSSGEPRVVCKGMPQPYAPIIGPTNIAFSTSGKSFACGMSDGWVHVFDTATWTERAVIKKAAPSPIARPVDLVFSPDEVSITIVANAGFVTYDAKTAAELKRVTLKHPASLGFAPRHARFDDGTIAVRLWNGSAAIFAADGTWQRDVKLAPSAPIGALDSFSANGATYAASVGKTLHVVDLATGEDHPIELAAAPKSVAASPDGKTIIVANPDGTIATIAGGKVTPLVHATGARAGFAGASPIVWRAKDVLDLYASGAPALSLEVNGEGLVAQDASGAFETRGKPELACVVGKTFLTRETCADRAKDGVVADWIRAAR